MFHYFKCLPPPQIRLQTNEFLHRGQFNRTTVLGEMGTHCLALHVGAGELQPVGQAHTAACINKVLLEYSSSHSVIDCL